MSKVPHTDKEMQELVDLVIKAVCKAVPKAGFKPFPVKFEWTPKRKVVGVMSVRTITRSKNDFTPVDQKMRFGL